MHIIRLSQGLIAVVDDEDAWLDQYNWAAARRYGVWYAFRNVDRPGEPRTTQYLHHAIMGPPPEGGVIDHIDGYGLNCTRENMRVASHETNIRNQVRSRTKASSGYAGVRKHGKKWTAYISVKRRMRIIGSYDTAEAANLARLHVEKDSWGIQPRRLPAFIEAGLVSEDEDLQGA